MACWSKFVCSSVHCFTRTLLRPFMAVRESVTKNSVRKDASEKVKTRGCNESHMAEGMSAHSESLQRHSPSVYYTEVTTGDFHAKRRREMLEKYPEIVHLFGNDVNQVYFCLCTVVIQLSIAIYIVPQIDNMFVLFVLTYLVSGTLNHSLLLANHEVTHDLFFSSRLANQLCSYAANLPIGFPIATMFKLYHAEHHSGMGVKSLDTDLPSFLEAKIFRGSVGKAIWLSLQPFFYGLRPFIIKPPTVVGMGMVYVAIVQILFDCSIYYFCGLNSLLYLIGGSLLGTGLHPMSGHFVAEHFEFIPGQETYSYYGPLNYLTYNVGHHVEHHDFPKIPGSRLPLLRKIAPEYYENIPSYSSWTRVIADFILSKNVNLYSRIQRK